MKHTHPLDCVHCCRCIVTSEEGGLGDGGMLNATIGPLSLCRICGPADVCKSKVAANMVAMKLCLEAAHLLTGKTGMLIMLS